MGKNTVVMSLSVKPDFHKLVKRISEERGVNNVSDLCRTVVQDFVEIDPQAYDKLRCAADQRGIPISELVEYLVDKFPLGDEGLKPIVLKVPVEVVRDRQALENWLTQKVKALVSHLHPS